MRRAPYYCFIFPILKQQNSRMSMVELSGDNPAGPGQGGDGLAKLLGGTR